MKKDKGSWPELKQKISIVCSFMLEKRNTMSYKWRELFKGIIHEYCTLTSRRRSLRYERWATQVNWPSTQPVMRRVSTYCTYVASHTSSTLHSSHDWPSCDDSTRKVCVMWSSLIHHAYVLVFFLAFFHAFSSHLLCVCSFCMPLLLSCAFMASLYAFITFLYAFVAFFMPL